MEKVTFENMYAEAATGNWAVKLDLDKIIFESKYCILAESEASFLKLA
jgi:hypothetical protein